MNFPFEIPEALEMDVLANIATANPPWADLDEWVDNDEEPILFGYFCSWHCRTEYLLTNLKRIIDQMDPVCFETEDDQERWNALNGVVQALELRLSQFAGLLAWGRVSWPYDPGIRDKDLETDSGSDTEGLPGQDGLRNVLPMKGGAA